MNTMMQAIKIEIHAWAHREVHDHYLKGEVSQMLVHIIEYEQLCLHSTHDTAVNPIHQKL